MVNFKNWLQQPFSPSMDAWHWFMFYGLILVIAFGWKLVLNTVEGGIR